MPLFSICIPQYNRTRQLRIALAALQAQAERDFEVCVSDDRSTDGRSGELEEALRSSGLAYRYRLQERNLGYDANLRSALALSTGAYCLLMGNDDCLNGTGALSALRCAIEVHARPAAVITDYADWGTRVPAQRIRETRLLTGGPAAAIAGFRNCTFVSGVVLAGEPARSLATARWDGLQMYQMYLLCRIVSGGGALLQVAEPLVLKDIAVDGEREERFDDQPRLDPCPIEPRDEGLAPLLELASTEIAEGAGLQGEDRRRMNFAIARQLYAFTYPYWMIEYRRVQSRAYALGVALALAPSRACRNLEFGAARRLAIWSLFLASLCAALAMPLRLFSATRLVLYRYAKTTPKD